MSERVSTPWRTAGAELTDLIFSKEDRTYRRIPFELSQKQYAVEFINSRHSLTAGFWRYERPEYPGDEAEHLIGAIKFRKDKDEIGVRYDGIDHTELNYFAEGLTPDREVEREDLERFQPLMEQALKKARND